MRREQLLHRIETAWTALLDSVDGLSAARLEEPGVLGDWSVKDVLAHVTTWEEETLKYLPVIASGNRTPRYASQGGIDAFNARVSEEKRSLSLAQVRRQLNETHRRLIAFIEKTPDDQFATETRFRRRLRYDTYGHYPEHVEAIREWRKRVESGS